MATKTAAAEAASETKEQVNQELEAKKSDWDVFSQMGLFPAQFKCDGYKSSHPTDMSCHSAFSPTAENVLRHMAPEHGLGVFQVRFRISDSKKSPIWEELKKANVLIREFWCPHCRSSVEFSPRTILFHLKNHPGATRTNLFPQVICMQLTTPEVQREELESLYDFNG